MKADDSLDKRSNTVVEFEAEHGFEYSKKDAISGCHKILEQKVKEYIQKNNLAASDYELSAVEDKVEIEVYVDEYICNCKQKLTITK